MCRALSTVTRLSWAEIVLRVPVGPGVEAGRILRDALPDLALLFVVGARAALVEAVPAVVADRRGVAHAVGLAVDLRAAQRCPAVHRRACRRRRRCRSAGRAGAAAPLMSLPMATPRPPIFCDGVQIACAQDVLEPAHGRGTLSRQLRQHACQVRHVALVEDRRHDPAQPRDALDLVGALARLVRHLVHVAGAVLLACSLRSNSTSALKIRSRNQECEEITG